MSLKNGNLLVSKGLLEEAISEYRKIGKGSPLFKLAKFNIELIEKKLRGRPSGETVKSGANVSTSSNACIRSIPKNSAGRKNNSRRKYYYDSDQPDRRSVSELVQILLPYEIISFDVFDTAIFRAVVRPNDVFRLMGLLLEIKDFSRKRKLAESEARETKNRIKGTREVTLDEIYEILNYKHGAKDEWKQIEKEIEISLSRRNQYIFEVYEALRHAGKRLIFTSDMYLPRETIAAMLENAGYRGYEEIYVSNEYSARKGDGTLQRVLVAKYGSGRSIAHVGDVYEADVVKSNEAGIFGVHNPDQRGLLREKNMSSLAGSFYQAVIDNCMGASEWLRDIYYTHGFRVGGILTLGYVEFIERTAKSKGVDKIIFFGRDCYIVSKVYRRFYGALPSAYLETSRAASLQLTASDNFSDFIERVFFRWYKETNNSRPLFQLLIDTGFEYLVSHLNDYDIEPYLFPANTDEQQLRQFFWEKKSVIVTHLAEMREAAHEYFASAIGDATSVLAVDIGWTGTCITAFRDFINSNDSHKSLSVYGALLCTSRDESVSDAISDGSISAYVYSPLMNQDMLKVIMPDGNISREKRDLLTHPIEYIFTEAEATTIGYVRDDEGRVVPLRGANRPPNVQQILSMQRGIVDFCERYLDYSKGFHHLREISPYVAFQPLRHSLGEKQYLHEVYKDFIYDATSAIHGKTVTFQRFGSLFPAEIQKTNLSVKESDGHEIRSDQTKGRILFVSPEMTYMGAPHSLLRLCKVARNIGYEPVVWTMRSGPFENEFNAHGFLVTQVSSKEISRHKLDELIQNNIKLVVCNTVVTDEFVRLFEGVLPVIWYVREATNIPNFIRGNPLREETLKKSASVTVVSEYAAQALRKFVERPISVVRNAVEDLSHLGAPYKPYKNGVIKFVQLGTIEYRKGYDVLIAAYKALPKVYRTRSEIHFAGGFINSATSFASYLFGQVEGEPGIHFHGLIDNESKKVEFLSQMDVVVVASRDESCSLVALEGAMLSKPLIVTENVGAKYMVDDSTGIVVEPGSVSSLRDALIRFIDKMPSELTLMGRASRLKYNELASMEAHSRDLANLFENRIKDGPGDKIPEISLKGRTSVAPFRACSKKVVVSLTSYPPRMATIVPCIKSLKNQSKVPDQILLWLSKEQFPMLQRQLPQELLSLVDNCFEIRWVDGDLAPHKKYFYAMQELPDAIVITVDDDVAYDPDLISTLFESHLQRPKAVIAGRCNLIRFRPNGELRTYRQWSMEHQGMREIETYTLLPTGIGGVLYPPGSVPQEAFDVDAIKKTCLYADDLWLKFMTTANGYPVWMPNKKFDYRNIVGSQDVALWMTNVVGNNNDKAIDLILELFREKYNNVGALLRRIRGVRSDGTFHGEWEELDRISLLHGFEYPLASRNRLGEDATCSNFYTATVTSDELIL